jgi:hypothetical protein
MKRMKWIDVHHAKVDVAQHGFLASITSLGRYDDKERNPDRQEEEQEDG